MKLVGFAVAFFGLTGSVFAGQPPEFAARVTASELEGVNSRIRPCWNFSMRPERGSPGEVVPFDVALDRGVPISAEVVDLVHYLSNAPYRAVADAAKTAILNPRCGPWPVSITAKVRFRFDSKNY